MGSDGNSGNDLESISKSGSARVSRDSIHNTINFFDHLKLEVPEFPYEFDGVPDDRLRREEGCIDFYMERIGPAPDDGTKIIHVYTSDEPSTISMPRLAEIAGKKLSGITPPEEIYLCLRFKQHTEN